jgi:hypothetical protein
MLHRRRRRIEVKARGHTYLHIADRVLPAPRAGGVSDEQIRAMAVENPGRIFKAQGAYERLLLKEVGCCNAASPGSLDQGEAARVVSEIDRGYNAGPLDSARGG